MAIKFRLIIVLVLGLAIALLAGRNVAWAGPRGAEGQAAVQSSVENAPAAGKPEPGSVKPPPAEVEACKNGVYSVGGVSTLQVTDLAPGYCITAFLRNHAFAVGQIPEDVGEVLAHITFLRVFYSGKLVSELPVEDGKSQICYAVPPGKTGQIYFLDFYGPRFGRPIKNTWVALDTTVDNGMACAAAQGSGAYALIGK